MRSVIRQRLSGWIGKRIPAAQEHTLTHRKIFILPSRFGAWFMVLCALLFVLGTNYQNNLMRLMCAFLLALFLTHILSSYINFSKLRIKASRTDTAFAGQQSCITLVISFVNKPAEGLLHLSWWQSALHDISCAALNEDPTLAELAFTLANRGRHRLPRVTIRSDYPLGLIKCWTHLDLAQSLVVYPSPIACEIRLFKLPAEDENAEAVSIGGRDDFHALREYTPSDPLSNVAWKQVAKSQSWLVKAFEQPESTSGWLTWASANAPDIEMKLSQLTHQVIELNNKGVTFGLTVPGIHIAPAKGSEHMHACLTALACYQHSDGVQSI